MAVALTTLLVMAGSAVAALRGLRGATLVMIVAFALWLAVDDPLAGPVLVRLTDRHGLHVGDVLAAVGVLVVLLRIGRRAGS